MLGLSMSRLLGAMRNARRGLGEKLMTANANERGEVISTKRQPEGPKLGFMVEGATLETVTPILYNAVNDLKSGY